jgi:chromosomal replication initiator protein
VVSLSPPDADPHPWDGFLTAPENALAHASVLALARGEGAGITPLVIHGLSGVGKSRLLSGLISERLLRCPGSSVAHLATEAFAALCAEAGSRPGGWAELRAQFRLVDLFVLEDLNALERAPLALAELTHTLDALDEVGAHVAVSAREGPGRWSGWPARLVSRLVGGLSVRIEPPGPSMRRRYLLDRARVRGISLTAEAVDALAEAADGFRTLEGWLVRLALSARIERRPLDRSLVGALLEQDTPSPTPTLDQVARAVASHFGVRLRDLRSATRRQNVTEPRHLAIHLVRGLTGLSYQSIGAYFGGRDPATIRHACKAAADRLARDPALAAAISALDSRWRSADRNPPLPKS